MKKITLFTLALLSISFGLLNAQTNQGRVLIGVSSTLNLAETGSDLMNLNFSSIKYKSDADDFEEPKADKMTNINFLPKVGYFIADNFALGLDLNFDSATEKDGEDDDKYTQTIFGIGPFVRYYIPTAKVLPFFEISSSFGTINSKYDYSDNSGYDDEKYESSVILLGGGIGLAAPLGDRVNFDVLVGYNYLRTKREKDNEENFRTIFETVGLKIGFTVLLGAK